MTSSLKPAELNSVRWLPADEDLISDLSQDKVK